MAEKQNTKVDPSEEVGSTGLPTHSGKIFEEFLPELKGKRAFKAYREMRDNDSTVGAILFAVDMLIRQVEWTMVPASETPLDQEFADFMWSVLNDMSTTWEDTLSEILSMLVFGFSAHEIVYKRRLGEDAEVRSKFDDGRIGWRKLPIRAQETVDKWVFADDGGIDGFDQVAPPSYQRVFIPIEKSLLFRTSTHKGNPEGRSILRNAWRAYTLKKQIEDSLREQNSKGI